MSLQSPMCMWGEDVSNNGMQCKKSPGGGESSSEIGGLVLRAEIPAKPMFM